MVFNLVWERQENLHWIFLFQCRLLISSATQPAAGTSVRSQPYFNAI